MSKEDPTSEMGPGERVARRMLDERTFPEHVEKEALEYLDQGEQSEALQVLIKSLITR